MSMKAPFIVNEAKEALESGNSVVIGLQTTGEVLYGCFWRKCKTVTLNTE